MADDGDDFDKRLDEVLEERAAVLRQHEAFGIRLKRVLNDLGLDTLAAGLIIETTEDGYGFVSFLKIPLGLPADHFVNRLQDILRDLGDRPRPITSGQQKLPGF